jgi:cytosol alanyl aminopeptidase
LWRHALAGSAFLLHLLKAATPPPPEFLLPDAAEPRQYALDLTIVPSAPAFRGIVTIDIELKRKLSFLWLNGKDLAVDSAVLRAGERSLAARTVSAGAEFLGFALPQSVGPGPARLEIHYRGKLGEKPLAGAFRKQAAGDWYVFTSFTAIDARRAFPCFDEPRYKTPWRLTLHVERKQVALANTRAVSESEEPNGMKRVVFGATLPLPSSLVAFAIGPFDVVDDGRAGKSGAPVRIVTPRGRTREATAVRGHTARLVQWLEEYTGIDYPFEKVDHLALLEGTFGATEYPGLITYQQGILLARPDGDAPDRQRRMRAIMAHELAHQWFGNLVTMSGWQDVWLSEGFATWMGAKIMDGEEPATRTKVPAVVARHRIMEPDAPAGARPVRLEMHSREQMRDVYGRLVYQKGAATLGMIEHWLGEVAFQRGIRSYLSEHKFANATTADFVSAMSRAAGQDVGGILSGLLDRPGVPVVTAEIRCDSRSSPRVALRQQPDSRFWRLPVCLKVAGGSERCAVTESRETEVALTEVAGCPSWVFPNAGASGYYRIRLNPDVLQALWRQGTGQLTAAERLTLALDVAELYRNKSLTAAQTMGMLPIMAQDSEPLVALVALDLAGVLSGF